MALRSSTLVLILLANYGPLGVHMRNFSDGVLKQEQGDDQSPKIQCTINTNDVKWETRKAGAEVSVEIQFEGTAELSVLPSVHLIALPKKHNLEQREYWAPFAVTTGASTKEKQRLTPVTAAHSLSVRVVPSQLLWAPTKSSVWPSHSFAKAVPPGQYGLQVQFELSDGKTISSNEVEIAIIK